MDGKVNVSREQGLPCVLFVPGLGLDRREWDGVRGRLRGQTTGTVDHDSVVQLPSLGERVALRTDLRVEAAAERLMETIPARGSEVVLVGHSASCPVVIETAVRCAQVSGLVLIGPVTDPRAATWPRMVRRWARTAVHERLWEIPVLVPQYYRTGPSSMARGMNALRVFRSDLALARTHIPVSVVRGSLDRISPHDWCQHLADMAGGPATVVSVTSGAHMVPITHPQAVVTAIRATQESVRRDAEQPDRPTTHE